MSIAAWNAMKTPLALATLLLEGKGDLPKPSHYAVYEASCSFAENTMMVAQHVYL